MERLYNVTVVTKTGKRYNYFRKGKNEFEAKDFIPQLHPKDKDGNFDFDSEPISLDVQLVKAEELDVYAVYSCGTPENYYWLKEQAEKAGLMAEKDIGSCYQKVWGQGNWTENKDWVWKLPMTNCNWLIVAKTEKDWIKKYIRQLENYQKLIRLGKKIQTISEAQVYKKPSRSIDDDD